MLSRKQNTWRVILADERTNETIPVEFKSYWSRDKDFITSDSVGVAAAAQAVVEAKGQRRFIPVAVEAV